MVRNNSQAYRHFNRGLWIAAVVIAAIMIFLIRYNVSDPKKEETISDTNLVCTRLEEKKVQDRQPALTPVYKWAWRHNMVLSVHFKSGTSNLTGKVIDIANEWALHCGMSFKEASNPLLSQIRVSFEGRNYASAIGRECFQYAANVPTMYLGGLDTMRNMREFRRIVLHEFGHALGLEHEMKNPNARIPWDTSAVYKYYKDHFNWEKPQVMKNIFAQLDVKKGERYDEFDSTSIMVYAIPDTLTKGRMRVEWPYDLSTTDKVSINAWYRKQ